MHRARGRGGARDRERDGESYAARKRVHTDAGGGVEDSMTTRIAATLWSMARRIGSTSTVAFWKTATFVNFVFDCQVTSGKA